MAEKQPKLYRINAATVHEKAKAAYCLMRMEEAVNPELDVATGKVLTNPIPNAVFKEIPESDTFDNTAQIDEIEEAMNKGDKSFVGIAERFTFASFKELDHIVINFIDETIDVDDFFDRFELDY